MKKTILLLILLLICGCSNIKSVNTNIDDNYYCNVFVNMENKDIIDQLKNDNYFICDKLDKYLDYVILNIDSISNIVREVNVGLYRDYYTDTKKSDLSKDYLVLVNKYHYLNSDYVPNDLEVISNDCNVGINNNLRRVARQAFEKLCYDAKKEKIYIYNLSAYRSYEKQYKIYNNNLQTKGVEGTNSVSAKPGYSEHQTGLTVDINLLSKEFDKTNEYHWMKENAYKYGFIERYPKDNEKITGYEYEPWHYRYVGKEVAEQIQNENITFDEYYAYYIDDN